MQCSITEYSPLVSSLGKKAKALLLDEPTSGLGPKAASEFSALLKGMRDSAGVFSSEPM